MVAGIGFTIKYMCNYWFSSVLDNVKTHINTFKI